MDSRLSGVNFPPDLSCFRMDLDISSGEVPITWSSFCSTITLSISSGVAPDSSMACNTSSWISSSLRPLRNTHDLVADCRGRTQSNCLCNTWCKSFAIKHIHMQLRNKQSSLYFHSYLITSRKFIMRSYFSIPISSEDFEHTEA